MRYNTQILLIYYIVTARKIRILLKEVRRNIALKSKYRLEGAPENSRRGLSIRACIDGFSAGASSKKKQYGEGKLRIDMPVTPD
jgi:hypothetical protein